MGGYHAFGLLLAGAVSVAVGRLVLGLPSDDAGRVLAVVMVFATLDGLTFVLLGREVFSSFLGLLGARHHLPLAKVGSEIGIRTKLYTALGGFSLALLVLGLLGPFCWGPGRFWAWVPLVCGGVIVGFLARWFVIQTTETILAIQTRAQEMAKGALARPLALTSEADEIGQMAVAFEEMRRAIRAKLRTTESINLTLSGRFVGEPKRSRLGMQNWLKCWRP